MRRISLRCDCGEHALEIPRAIREQFFGDATLGMAPWPLAEGKTPAPAGDHEVALAVAVPWFNGAQSGINNRRELLRELFTLLGRMPSGEVVPTHVFLQAPRVGTAMIEARESLTISTDWDGPSLKGGITPFDVDGWASRFGVPGVLPVPHIRCLDKDNAQVDPDWLQGVLWRSPFQLRRGDLLTFFEPEFTALHALMLHVARTGEPLTAHVD